MRCRREVCGSGFGVDREGYNGFVGSRDKRRFHEQAINHRHAGAAVTGDSPWAKPVTDGEGRHELSNQ